MATFLLVHGSCHGAWCWYRIIPLLERAGHRVIAPDLSSLGRDKTPIAEVTATTWADSICTLLDAQAEPVVLVGHSRGGIVITQAAQGRPDKVRTLVYLTALLPGDGQSAMALAQAPENAGTQMFSNMVVDEEQGCVRIRDEAVRDAFYNCCSDEDVALARLLLQPETMAPLVVPVHTTAERFGRVPRVYIECLRDNALTPAFQRAMYQAVPCRQVIALDTDHSPFFSTPAVLAEHLLAIADGH